MIIPSTPTGSTASSILNPAVFGDLHDIGFVAFHRVEMLFLPHAWINAPAIKCAWKQFDFPPGANKKMLPKSPGVYVFFLEPKIFDISAKNVFYIGKATSLHSRIDDYIGNNDKLFLDTNRPLVWKMLNLWSGHLKYCFTETVDVAAAEHLENEMINAFRPPFNTRYDATTSKTMRAFT